MKIYILFYIPLFIVSMVTFNRTMSCYIENFLLCILIKVIMTSKITSRRIRTDITFDHIVVLPKETSYRMYLKPPDPYLIYTDVQTAILEEISSSRMRKV
jgi:hypothetical protein